jgi:hypothetical protein
MVQRRMLKVDDADKEEERGKEFTIWEKQLHNPT